jgi:hypothetical protein
MTLAISLRVPDGVIIAADSLMTTIGHIGVYADIKATCPECSKEFKIEKVAPPPIPVPSSISSFAQKVFPFLENFGVATYGQAILNEKTIYYHVKMLEKNFKLKKEEILTASKVSKIIEDYFSVEIKKHFKDFDKAPPDFSPLGFLVAGYDRDVAKTLIVNIGKMSKTKAITGSGCTYGGDGYVVDKLWALGKEGPQRSTNYAAFSLQDAVDYSEYLIGATANFQRFANMIPSVGGEVDVGLITPFGAFTWIKCKALTKQLEI